MDDEKQQKNHPADDAGEAAKSRKQREAEALRANLARRKVQVRLRNDGVDDR